MIRTLKITLSYFGIVFGVGFLLGIIRVPFLAPALGERIAEMIELPFMLAAIFLAASWIVHHYRLESGFATALVSGLLAASILLMVEFSVVLWIRGISVSDFLANRDPVAGTLYYIAVGIFAVMPGLLSLWNRRRDHG